MLQVKYVLQIDGIKKDGYYFHCCQQNFKTIFISIYQSLHFAHLINKIVASLSSEVLDIVSVLLLPKGKVLLEKLDNGFGISEGLFIDIIDFLKSLGQSLFSDFASLGLIVHHLIVEN